jgi:hypothetical protein
MEQFSIHGFLFGGPIIQAPLELIFHFLLVSKAFEFFYGDTGAIALETVTTTDLSFPLEAFLYQDLEGAPTGLEPVAALGGCIFLSRLGGLECRGRSALYF